MIILLCPFIIRQQNLVKLFADHIPNPKEQTKQRYFEWIENQKQSLDVQLSGLTLTALILQSLTHTAQLLTAAPVEAVAVLLCMTVL